MINLIWAMDKNRLIGKDNDLPWHYKEDLQYFKEITLNHTVLMGRKTFDSIVSRIKKPLPKRKNVVLTRTIKESEFDNVEYINNVDEYLSNLKEDIFVIGGSSIYEQTLKYADRLYITHIDNEYEGDAYFPEIDLSEYKKIKSDKSGELEFAVYERSAR